MSAQALRSTQGVDDKVKSIDNGVIDFEVKKIAYLDVLDGAQIIFLLSSTQS